MPHKRSVRRSLLGPTEMRQTQVGDDRFKAPVREGQRLSVALPELGSRERRRASLIIGSAISTPTAIAPRSAARPAKEPGPQAISTMRVPA